MDSFFDGTDESLLRWRMSVEEENSIAEDEDSTAEPLLKTVV